MAVSSASYTLLISRDDPSEPYRLIVDLDLEKATFTWTCEHKVNHSHTIDYESFKDIFYFSVSSKPSMPKHAKNSDDTT